MSQRCRLSFRPCLDVPLSWKGLASDLDERKQTKLRDLPAIAQIATHKEPRLPKFFHVTADDGHRSQRDLVGSPERREPRLWTSPWLSPCPEARKGQSTKERQNGDAFKIEKDNPGKNAEQFRPPASSLRTSPAPEHHPLSRTKTRALRGKRVRGSTHLHFEHALKSTFPPSHSVTVTAILLLPSTSNFL